MEEGDNGVLPWGLRPSIAKMPNGSSPTIPINEEQKAYCRVNVKDAWLSHSKDHLDASRWSCRRKEIIPSSFVVSLNAQNTLGVEVRVAKKKTTIKHRVHRFLQFNNLLQMLLQVIRLYRSNVY